MTTSHSSARYRTGPGGRVAGELTVPGDKSISHRALMFGGIAEGDTEITGFLAGEDCLSTLRALQAMGVRIERPEEQLAHGSSGLAHGSSDRAATERSAREPPAGASEGIPSGDGHVIVHGVGPDGLRPSAAPLDMGNAGTAIRLFMGLLAPQRFDSTLIGDDSLMRRPMERVAGPLRSMGANIKTLDGRPPVEIGASSGMRAIDYALPVASAQVKSAILLAGLQAFGRTHVTEPAPSRDHTERMLGAFGVEVLRDGPRIAIEGGQTLRGTQVKVPGDFSSAAFFIVAGCLAAENGLLLRNIGVNPTRTGLIELLQLMGADIRVHLHGGRGSSDDPNGEPMADIEVRKSRLRGIKVPEGLVPLSIDEFPVLFVAAACAEGETLVRGALELRVKESDRLAAMAQGLTTLGVENQLLADGLWIRGGDGFGGGTIDSLGDHRIAMSFAIASLKARAPIEILDVANVATSFPGFVATARAAGLHIEAT